MNKELKEQAHKEFDEKFGFLKEFISKDNDFGEKDWNDIVNHIDSIIDKTVQSERERIVGIAIKYIRSGEVSGSFSGACDCSDCDKYEEKVRKDLKSLITNKSNINNNKE